MGEAGTAGGAPALALVTGGHRRLGARIAGALARAGYRLALHGSHDAAPDAELARTLAETGVEWQGFVADFEQPEAATALMDAVAAHFGQGPDLLVNSAAIFGQDRLESVTGADLTRHHAINCAAPRTMKTLGSISPLGARASSCAARRASGGRGRWR